MKKDTIRAIIVEDVESNYDTLFALLELCCPTVEIVGWATNCRQAIEMIKSKVPDLLFLDIELPDGLGFDILEQILPHQPAFICTTGKDHYWVRAFELSAAHYLLKPLGHERLIEAVRRIEDRQRVHFMAEQYEIIRQRSAEFGKNSLIAFEDQEVMIFRPVGDIVLIDADDSKALVYLKDYQIQVMKGLGYYEALFNGLDFIIKTHRSTLVNLDEIKHFDRADHLFLMRNGLRANFAESRRDACIDMLRKACNHKNTQRPRIELSNQKIISFPYLDEILYLQNEKASTHFSIAGYKDTVQVSKNIGEFIDLCDINDSFIKIHRSFIVNLHAILYCDRNLGVVYLRNGKALSVADSHKEELLARINTFKLPL